MSTGWPSTSASWKGQKYSKSSAFTAAMASLQPGLEQVLLILEECHATNDTGTHLPVNRAREEAPMIFLCASTIMPVDCCCITPCHQNQIFWRYLVDQDFVIFHALKQIHQLVGSHQGIDCTAIDFWQHQAHCQQCIQLLPTRWLWPVCGWSFLSLTGGSSGRRCPYPKRTSNLEWPSWPSWTGKTIFYQADGLYIIFPTFPWSHTFSHDMSSSLESRQTLWVPRIFAIAKIFALFPWA